MSLRQKHALFWSRVSRFWTGLACVALMYVFLALFLFFDNTLVHIIRLFDVHGWLSSDVSAVNTGPVGFFETFWSVITLDGAELLSSWLSFAIVMSALVTELLSNLVYDDMTMRHPC